jgi:hypothetical protein
MVANLSTMPGTSTMASVQNSARRIHRLFYVSNVLVCLLVIVALIFNPYAYLGTGAYVILLFILCSLPLLLVTSYRGKASLMLMFMAYYFATFGLKDLSNLVLAIPVPPRITSTFFTAGEIGIFIGGIAFLAGYALTSAFITKSDAGVLKREWSPQAVIVAGIIVWLIGFYTNGYIQLGVGDQYSLKKHSLGPLGGFISLARMLGPLGVLMLTYSYLTTRSKLALFVLIGMMLGDFVLGFVGDTKDTAFRGPLLFLFSYVILRERIPILVTVIFVVAAGLGFDYFAAYRTELGSRHETRTTAIGKIDTKQIAGYAFCRWSRLLQHSHFVERQYGTPSCENRRR